MILFFLPHPLPLYSYLYELSLLQDWRSQRASICEESPILFMQIHQFIFGTTRFV